MGSAAGPPVEVTNPRFDSVRAPVHYFKDKVLYSPLTVAAAFARRPVAGIVVGARWGGAMEPWIEVGGGRGYLALPAGGSGPGLILFAGANGSKELTALADLYAEEGYVTLAVDGDYAAAAKALHTRGEASGEIGAVGFGKGAKAALEAVAAGAVACAAVY